jgi:hypothetical protein
MKRLIAIAILAFLGWQGYQKYEGSHLAWANPQDVADVNDLDLSHLAQTHVNSSSSFKCDGRTHCSHMTSCEEAIFFLQNCPGVKMDGNNDGIPCEKQWCR